jgi:hypothetical protein
MLVMDPVRCHPENGAALERQGAADREEVFHPLGRLVAPMGEQAVIRHADSEAAGHPPENQGGQHGAIVDVEERGHGADVKRRHRDERDGVEALSRLAAVDVGNSNHGNDATGIQRNAL